MIWLWLLGCPFVTDAQLSALQDADGDGVLSQRFGGGDCDDEDPSVGAPSRWAPDDDGDGFGALGEGISSCESQPGLVDNEGDCDDTDPNVGLSRSLFADQDGDGFGDPSAPHPGCALEPGFVADDTDCDDQDEDSHPGAVWHQDSDGDTFGDPDISEVSCLSPPGSFVPADPAGFDCDDTDASVYPGQPLSVEQPADGADTNCDGRTELDFDGDGLADIRGCEGLTPTVVSVQPGQTALQDAIDAIDPGDDCVILELQDGTYGGALLGGPPHLAIVAAPGATPVLAQSAAQTVGIDVGDDTERSLTLEGLELQGFDIALRARRATSVLASGLVLWGCGGFESDVEDPLDWISGNTLEIYSSSFFDGAEVVGLGWGMVLLHDLRVESAQSARTNSVIAGGSDTTLLDGVEIRDSLAARALVFVLRGERLDILDSTFEDNLTPTIEARVADLEMLDVAIRGTISEAPQLINLDFEQFGLGNAHMDGLVIEDNIWDAPALGNICTITGPAAMLLFASVDIELESSTIRNNERYCHGSLVYAGRPFLDGHTILRDVELSSGSISEGSVGITMRGDVSGSTIAGFEVGIELIEDPGNLVEDSIIVGLDEEESVAVRYQPEDDPDIRNNTIWLASYALGTDVLNDIEDPLFLRYHPSLPPSLWDLSLHPGSASSGRGAYPSGSDATLDEDADGLYDLWEERWCGGTSCLPGEDPDGDTLDNEAELAMGTLPLGADTDSDNTTDPDDDDPLDPTR